MPPWDWAPSWGFKSQICPRGTSSSSAGTVEVCLSYFSFSARFLSVKQVFALVSFEYPHVCVFTVLKQWFALCPKFSERSKESCLFSACSVFPEQTDFQSPYLPNWKLKSLAFLVYMTYLYILHSNSLSFLDFINIFSHYITYCP